MQNKINIKFTTSTYQSAHTHLEFINKRWWRQQFTDKTQLNSLPIHHADIILITSTYYLLALRSVSESLMNPPALALSLSLSHPQPCIRVDPESSVYVPILRSCQIRSRTDILQKLFGVCGVESLQICFPCKELPVCQTEFMIGQNLINVVRAGNRNWAGTNVLWIDFN